MPDSPVFNAGPNQGSVIVPTAGGSGGPNARVYQLQQDPRAQQMAQLAAAIQANIDSAGLTGDEKMALQYEINHQKDVMGLKVGGASADQVKNLMAKLKMTPQQYQSMIDTLKVKAAYDLDIRSIQAGNDPWSQNDNPADKFFGEGGVGGTSNAGLLSNASTSLGDLVQTQATAAANAKKQADDQAAAQAAQDQAMKDRQGLTDEMHKYFEMMSRPVVDANGNVTDSLYQQLLNTGAGQAQTIARNAGVAGNAAATMGVQGAQSAGLPYLQQRQQLASQAWQLLSNRDISLGQLDQGQQNLNQQATQLNNSIAAQQAGSSIIPAIGSLIGGAAGTVIGGYAGGPAGAATGAKVGTNLGAGGGTIVGQATGQIPGPQPYVPTGSSSNHGY